MPRAPAFVVICAALLLSTTPKARAGFVDGNTLLDSCQTPTSSLCAGYLAAIVDYQDALQQLGTSTMTFCLPDASNLGRLRDLVIDALQHNPPSELRKLAVSLVVPALHRIYPCKS